ncbi:MAG: LamB/YcsF family protein [Pyrinomonadaceae bacterium]|nr:LamB/YcsF family protein [Pyrinomonadaceae bacterium]
MFSVDLNCDMGESFGAWKMGNDAELMKYVSSANIACGFHAGDATTMRETVELAIENAVAIGAHPSFPDLQGFGRRSMSLTPSEVFDTVLYQVSALKGICDASGGKLHHVKPHGALYNQAARSRDLARAISESVKIIDPSLILYGLSGSFLISEADAIGLGTASEVFADRTYQEDGSLTPRSEPDALINDSDEALSQVLQMIKNQKVTAQNGAEIGIKAETVCIHGDGEHALTFAKAISEKLTQNEIVIRPGAIGRTENLSN